MDESRSRKRLSLGKFVINLPVIKFRSHLSTGSQVTCGVHIRRYFFLSSFHSTFEMMKQLVPMTSPPEYDKMCKICTEQQIGRWRFYESEWDAKWRMISNAARFSYIFYAWINFDKDRIFRAFNILPYNRFGFSSLGKMIRSWKAQQKKTPSKTTIHDLFANVFSVFQPGSIKQRE